MQQKSASARQARLGTRNAKWGYFFLIPWLIYFLIFTLYPFLYGIAVSFTDFSLAGMHFVGLDNYKSILSDQAFMRSAVATLRYGLIAIPLSILVSILVANALTNHGKILNTFTKLAFYLPSVVCFTALVLVWKYMVAPQSGFVIWFCKRLGIPLISLLDKPGSAITIMAVMVASVNFGQSVILYSAAIDSIPKSYHEAAMIDGATPWQRFCRITVPLLHSTTIFITITTTINTLQLFVIPYLMTNGAPQNKTSTILLMIYQNAFQNGKYGYASAIGVLFFLLTSVVAALQFRITRRETIEY